MFNTRRLVICISTAVLMLIPVVAEGQGNTVDRKAFPDIDLLASGSRTKPEKRQTVVIRGRWVWDGTGRAAILNGLILVKGERILAVGTEGGLELPPDAAFINRSDLFLMPGLVDSHEHFAMDQFAGVSQGELMERSAGHLALRAARNGRTALRTGVTTARIATEIVKYGQDYVAIDYAQAFNEGLLPGPRCVVAGHPLHPPESFPNYPALDGTGSDVSGVEEIRRRVREDIRAGINFCKMYIGGNLVPGPTESQSASIRDSIYFTKDEINTIIDECHRHRLKVTAHVLAGGPSVQSAIEAGIDSFEHPILFTPQEWGQLKEHKIFATLEETPLFVPGAEAMGWGGRISTPPDAEALLRDWYTNAIKSGAPLALGAGGYQQPGAMAHEIAVLVYFGMTNDQALLTATRNGGELTGLPVGTLEPGKYADVIGVRGNPLQDINAMKYVEFVMKGGKIYNLSEE